jgi:hypothetical protein
VADPLEEAFAEQARRSRIMAGDHSDDDPKTAKAADPEGPAADVSVRDGGGPSYKGSSG